MNLLSTYRMDMTPMLEKEGKRLNKHPLFRKSQERYASQISQEQYVDVVRK